MRFCVPVHFDLWLVIVVVINIGGCMRHIASVLRDKMKNFNQERPFSSHFAKPNHGMII